MPWTDFFHKPGGKDLDETSREILLRIIKNPEMNDKAISVDLSLSRYKVRKIREELFTNGYAKTTVIPNYYELGFKVVMFVHIKIRDRDAVNRFLTPIKDQQYPRIIFMVHDGLEGVGMGLFTDLEEATKMYQKISNMINHSEALEENPTIQMISLPNCEIKTPFFFSKPLEHKGSWDIDMSALERVL
jgi:DNA-binding Lrp family transcriptional regulator